MNLELIAVVWARNDFACTRKAAVEMDIREWHEAQFRGRMQMI